MPTPHFKIQEILFTRPHLIHRSYLSSIMQGLGDKVGIDPAMINSAMEDDRISSRMGNTMEAESEIPNSIAVVPVHGTLVHRGGWLEGCGIRSYEAIRADIEEALSNSNVSAILLDIDSGGGECAGLFDLADWLVTAGRKKPIYAFAHDFAFSAAYAIASCSKKLFVGQVGEVGSIGVVAVHYDVSAANKKEGIVITPIYAGAKKVDGWPYAPLSDSAKNDFQYSIDATYQKFVSLVARNRGMSEDAVRGTEAGCFIAPDAISNGLADKIASFDDVITEIFADIQTMSAEQESGHSALSNATAQRKGNAMPIKLFGRSKKAEDTPAEDENDKKVTTESEDNTEDKEMEGQPDQPTDDDTDSEDTESDAEVETDDDGEEDDDPEVVAKVEGYSEALAVVELAALSGKSIKSAIKMLEKGMTADEARKSLMSQQKTSASADVSAHHKGSAAPESEKMAVQMRARFQKKGK